MFIAVGGATLAAVTLLTVGIFAASRAGLLGVTPTVAFASTRNRDTEVYLLDAGHGLLYNLSLAPDAWDSNPMWSPDGTRIVFATDRDRGDFELYSMDIATGTLFRLTDNDVSDDNPVWSPAGRSIIFESWVGGNLDIYSMDTTGGNLCRLTRDMARDGDPA